MTIGDSKTSKSCPPVVIGNGFFDTTVANVTVAGFDLEVFTEPGLSDAFHKTAFARRTNSRGI